ncbi:pyruvate transporter mpc1 [Paramecium bursaria]
MAQIGNIIMNWVHSPTGPKTTHFWAPACNYFFPIQALYDWNRDPAKISANMQLVLTLYSCMFMRWALRIKPASYILFVMHVFNASLQGRLLYKRMKWENEFPELAERQKHLQDHDISHPGH